MQQEYLRKYSALALCSKLKMDLETVSSSLSMSVSSGRKHRSGIVCNRDVEKTDTCKVMSTVSTIALSVDINGNISLINKRILGLTGYEEKDLSGKKWFTTLIPDEFRPELCSLWQSFISGSITSIESLEIPLQKADGNVVDIVWNAVSLADDGNSFECLLITGNNIIRPKPSQTNLEENSSLFRKVVELSPLPVALLDSDYNPIYVNLKFTEIFGYILEDVSSMENWWDFAHWASLSQNKSQNNTVNTVYTNECQLLCKDGSVKDIEFNFSDVNAGRSLLFFKDLTDVKAAKKAFNLDELRLEALLELNQLNDSISSDILNFSLEKAVELTESQAGYVGFVNEDKKTVSMFAWSEASMRDCRIENISTVYHLDSMGLWGEPIRKRRTIVTNDYTGEHCGKKGVPDGHVGIRNHLGIPIFDNNRIVMVAGVGNKDEDYDSSDIRQVTLLMESTWKLIQKKQDEEKIKIYAEELERNNKELESLDRMKDEFMANITHELKTPLIPIKGYSELLFEGHLGSLGEEQRKSVSVILQNAQRLQKLIDSLLYMQNIRTGNIQYHLDSIGIAALLDRVTDDLLSDNNGDSPSLYKEYDSSLAYVCGNTTYLEQVFSHIIDNAFKFTSSDGSVTVCASQEKNRVHIVVKDTGIGISKSEMPHIFKRFYQVDGSLTRRYGGNGLGLYLCKSVVEAHGGSIWATSEEGKGTELHVVLPVVEDEQAC